jgi:zinc-finger-containing domain
VESSSKVNCPYCKREAEFSSSEEFYGTDYGTNVYFCRRCDAHVGTYGRSKRPLGHLANGQLRKARAIAHSVFDIMWQRGNMTRSHAYKWLGWKMKLPPELCHIGMFTVQQCRMAWQHAIRFYLTHSELNDCPDCQGSGDLGFPHRIASYIPCDRCNGEGQVQRGDIR